MTLISPDMPKSIIGEKPTAESMENSKDFIKELFIFAIDKF